MHLYQLAMELDERSADVAERAQALGLGDVSPTTMLTDDQVSALRSAYGRTGGPAAAPPLFTSPMDPQAEPPPPPPSSGRGKKIGAFALGAVALAGAVAFFSAQASPADERRQERSADLAAWEDAPAATVAPEVEAAVTFPPNQPRDKAKLCPALQTVVDEEASAPEIEPLQKDFTAFRKWLTDRGAWRDAINQVSSSGPPDGVPDTTQYRDTWERYFRTMYEASDSDLRGLADGIELNALDGMSKAITEAREDMKGHITAFCGDPQPAA